MNFEKQHMLCYMHHIIVARITTLTYSNNVLTYIWFDFTNVKNKSAPSDLYYKVND